MIFTAFSVKLALSNSVDTNATSATVPAIVKIT